MINLLSGKKHYVYTGYCLLNNKKKIDHRNYCRTEVYFKHLSHDEINWYIETEEPYDKAGSYAIQGIGSFMIKRINGSYSNVVGLPVCEVLDVLKKYQLIKY